MAFMDSWKSNYPELHSNSKGRHRAALTVCCVNVLFCNSNYSALNELLMTLISILSLPPTRRVELRLRS